MQSKFDNSKALRRTGSKRNANPMSKPKAARTGTLVEFFERSPLRGSGLKVERIRGGFRKIDFD